MTVENELSTVTEKLENLTEALKPSESSKKYLLLAGVAIVAIGFMVYQEKKKREAQAGKSAPSQSV